MKVSIVPERIYIKVSRCPQHFTGIEGVVFVGGVALGQPAKSIPIAAIVGLVCGLICGYLIYQFASRSSKFLLPCFLHPANLIHQL